jgi:cation diffusion facilitator CzcD-associated flavoprotein CzcO
MPTSATIKLDADVTIVGAGMCGLYALKVLRDQGLRVVVLERGAGVGGTWYWNRYPGARCDIPSLEYSFGFDPQLEQEWVWTEHFASQPEIERYLNHIADRYQLRDHIRLNSGVRSATFDESSNTWAIETENGETFRSRYCVMATGGLSAPNRPDFPGIDTFGGTIVQTSLWPAEGVELAGKRIGIIGTGSSGVQAIPELAKVAAHLTVFQRSPAFTWPSHNKPLSNEEQAGIKERYRQLRAEQYASFSGTAGTTGAVILQFATDDRKIRESTPEEREAALREHGLSACRVWTDTATDLDANEMAVELFREAVRRIVRDPQVAEGLSPTGDRHWVLRDLQS